MAFGQTWLLTIGSWGVTPGYDERRPSAKRRDNAPMPNEPAEAKPRGKRAPETNQRKVFFGRRPCFTVAWGITPGRGTQTKSSLAEGHYHRSLG